MATHLDTRNNKRSVLVLLEVIVVPVLSIAPIAAILIWVLGFSPSEQLTRGILYGCLFLACVVVGRWKFSLAGVGLACKNVWRGFFYSCVILLTSFAFIFILQPPEGWTDISLAILSPVLFYLVLALAEETWFRGSIFKALYEWQGALLAVFGSAVLFGLIHVPTHGWEGLLYSLSIGLPYAVARLKTDNLWGLIIAHWLTNLTDSFIRLSTTSLNVVWLTILHFVVFSGVSILILLLDRRLHRKE